MKVTLSKTQYWAVNDLRGLPHDAHMLLMCSHPTATGGPLEGPDQAFEELVSFIDEKMAVGMLSATATRALLSLCIKIDPECADWLGM